MSAMPRTSTAACSRRMMRLAASWCSTPRRRGKSSPRSAMSSKALRAALISLWFFPAVAGGEELITRPNLAQSAGARSISLNGQTFINQGLVGAGKLPAGTIDFLGDTLGSFSSLQVAPGSWKRVGDHYEGVLWTLPDRGRNDPAENIFFDYRE